ncbi:MAG TPA: LLM class flavin-dependent oxidoreductase [Polyangiaceae bacterium]|nr:LLM class flavin-dependent oxidoreductase [Polyangiaceae bacterium]
MHVFALDLSPVLAGETASDALGHSLALAEHAERIGLKRLWLAEYHNAAALACPCPELLIARLGAATSTLRLGAGGIMRLRRGQSPELSCHHLGLVLTSDRRVPFDPTRAAGFFGKARSTIERGVLRAARWAATTSAGRSSAVSAGSRGARPKPGPTTVAPATPVARSAART